MKVVILAGGEASRLRPLTCNISKIMVPVLNRPFLELIIGYFKKHDIIDIILAVGKSYDQIQDYFGDGSDFGVKITYSVEDFTMGTAGAVKNAEAFLHDSFIVFNGDIFTEIDLSSMMQLHRKNNGVASLALTPVDNPTIYGVVETDSQGRVRCFTEKPGWDEVTTNMINAGIYILEPDILSHITPNSYFMFERDVFPPLLRKGLPIYSYPSEAYWIDIGTRDKYFGLHSDLLQRCNNNNGVKFEGESFIHPSAKIEGPAIVGEGCFIGSNSLIRGPVVLGARCRVEEDSVVENAVLWEDCKVGKKSRLENCLIASRCHINEESEVLDDCILGADVVIGKGNKLSKGIKIWPGKTIEHGAISF